MAGTPTTNYNFPTYADTDVPDLTGAYNQAVNAIDAKIKEVADTIPSGADVPDATSTTKGIAKLYDSAAIGTGDQDDGGITPKAVDDKIGGSLTGYAPKFTAAAPITYSGNQIGIRYSNPAADGAQNGYGAVQVTGKQSDVAEANSLTTATVPNVKAVKDYVDAKVPTEQQAYTGTAPIVVNNGKHTISVSTAGTTEYDKETGFTLGRAGVIRTGGLITDFGVWNALFTDIDAANRYDALSAVPIANVVHAAIKRATPDATESVKGLVQLTDKPDHANNTKATTGVAVRGAINSVLQSWPSLHATATTPLTTEMLANLYVTPSGMVVYKAPTE